MALIHGQMPPAEPKHAPARLVVKLCEKRGAADRDGQLKAAREGLFSLEGLAGSAFEPILPSDGPLRAARRDPFDRYVAIRLDDRDNAEELAARLRARDDVEEAYVEGEPTPPPVNPDDDPRSGNQGYLAEAPGGIDARWAWAATDGRGIIFTDLEQGWTLDHEDLIDRGIALISGVSSAYHGHGTAVLGEVVAADSARGGIGIAPQATGRVVSQWRSDGSYNSAAAILSAGEEMRAGDVLLLEAQTTVGSSTYLPLEVETAVFDAIRELVNDGIVVVEAAGNGGNDLDDYRDSANRRILNRASSDFRDSGAIMVGAGSSAVPHRRLDFSNHGSRIDCYGWGENVDTAGDGWTGTSTTAYTTGFGGTSSASPIVAGAAVLLQSWCRQRRGQPMTPRQVRERLSSAHLNTPSADPRVDRIGVMPDLRAILEAEENLDRLRFREPNLAALLPFVIAGLLDDSPGIIWVPGRGPVPIDPDWGGRLAAGPKRDLLLAFAFSEIAKSIHDPASRARIDQASLAAMTTAANQIGTARAPRRRGLAGLLSRLFGLGSSQLAGQGRH